VVRAKLEGGEVHEAPAAADSSGEVVDLLAALQRSVERAKAARGEPVDRAEVAPDKKSQAKKKAAS